jgi:hypothetical protein
MKNLLIGVVILCIAASCDKNGTIEAIFQLRADSPLPAWVVLPANIKRPDIAVSITDYEATTAASWKVKISVKDKTTGRKIHEAMGIGYWHPDSAREKAPAAVYPHWFIIEVNGVSDIYEQSEHNNLLKIVRSLNSTPQP